MIGRRQILRRPRSDHGGSKIFLAPWVRQRVTLKSNPAVISIEAEFQALEEDSLAEVHNSSLSLHEIESISHEEFIRL